VILVLTSVLGTGTEPHRSARCEEPKPSGKPFVAEYDYTARWGHADEFIRLFKKNHLPVLKR
jgi:hypothetical protein